MKRHAQMVFNIPGTSPAATRKSGISKRRLSLLTMAEKETRLARERAGFGHYLETRKHPVLDIPAHSVRFWHIRRFLAAVVKFAKQARLYFGRS
jgi:hypothetical protein